jgi:hypothetical protein
MLVRSDWLDRMALRHEQVAMTGKVKKPSARLVQSGCQCQWSTARSVSAAPVSLGSPPGAGWDAESLSILKTFRAAEGLP